MLRDKMERPIRDLRISVTDRCDFRCSYCMPLEKYDWLKREEILSFEEIARVARVFASLGVEKIRLTGGEPLLRSGLDALIRQLSEIREVTDLALTTNGSRLAEQADRLHTAGLRRVNVSLDTLDAERFHRITKRDDLPRVLAGIRAAKRAGLNPIKINMVLERGVNDDDILPMVRFCREHAFSLRFIEFMDVGNSNSWNFDRVIPARDVHRLIDRHFPLEPVPLGSEGETAFRHRFVDGAGEIGFVASVTRPFCGNCSRARLTADGHLVTCLFAESGTDLKSRLRSGATESDLRELVASIWREREDRYSVDRLAAIESRAYDPTDRPKIEMIRLGG